MEQKYSKKLINIQMCKMEVEVEPFYLFIFFTTARLSNSRLHRHGTT